MKIIYENKEGGLSVIIPAPKFVSFLLAEFKKSKYSITELDVMEFIAGKDIPKIQDYIEGPEVLDSEGKPYNVMLPDGDPYLPSYQIVEDSVIPSDRTFRNAWRKTEEGMEINLDLSKEIAHGKRREAREKEFKPFDDIIAKQIPDYDPAVIEGERQKIREKYTLLQKDMESAETVQDLKKLLPAEF